ncbi:hypothetical protein LCGC14_1913890 [marine sediment metagenome]|uniref:Uncharacterized protein n=1 Tax=marine sediment metagenome TaxID=412755 RepID=A0A0F9FSL7_9ZZZZ
MQFFEANAIVDVLRTRFEELAVQLNEDHADIFGDALLGGSADVHASGGPQDYFPVGLLGFNGNMILLTPDLLEADEDTLEDLATVLFESRLRPN